MDELKRYEPACRYSEAVMVEQPNGDYVAFDDVQAYTQAAMAAAMMGALRAAGEMRDAAGRVSEWFCTQASHLEGPRIQALRACMVAYDTTISTPPDAMAALEAVKAQTVDATLNAANQYMAMQYGMGVLEGDREKIICAMKGAK